MGPLAQGKLQLEVKRAQLGSTAVVASRLTLTLLIVLPIAGTKVLSQLGLQARPHCRAGQHDLEGSATASSRSVHDDRI